MPACRKRARAVPAEALLQRALAAVVVLEAAFGVPGVVAAPVFYAYIKQELVDRGLI